MESTKGSDLKNTNEALENFFQFLFVENSWFTWFHIAILFASFGSGMWLWYVHHRAEKHGFASMCKVAQTPCSLMAKEWLDGVRQSNSQFSSMFSISAVAFAIGVWFESNGGGGMAVQVATYMPAVVLAYSQLAGILRSGTRIKRYLGV